MTWSARRRAWEAKRLGPALDRAPGTHASASARSATPRSSGCTAPGRGSRRRRRRPERRRRPDRGRPPRRAPPTRARALGRLRPAPRRRLARRAAVHPRHPPVRLPQPPLDDADVRGLRCGRGHERAVQVAPRRRPDRPLDRLRHADALRLRHRRSRGRGRVRDVRRRRQQPGRHGGPPRRPAARPGQHVDDDQLAGRPDLGDVHRRRREGRRPASGPRGDAPERHPQGVHRPEGVPVPAGAVDAPRDRHDRVRDARDAAAGTRSRSAATTSARPARPRSRSSPSRSPTGWPTSRPRSSAGCGSTTSRRGCQLLLQLAQRLLRGDRQVPGRRGGSGTSS